MTAYYNENNKKACAALRMLVAEGVIAPGFVDSRSIKEVSADDLRGFTQWHFFAGSGIWSVSARAAGWPDTRPLGTASCPCQPYSGAGKQLGVDDPRHLWPDLYRIISAARASGFGPPVWVGEQVAKAAGYGWFDGVRADLARQGFASRTVDIPACAIDAPHERNRLYWSAVRSGAVADATGERRGEGWPEPEFQRGRDATADADAQGHVDHAERAGWQGYARNGDDQAGRWFANRYAPAPDDALGAVARNGSHFADWEWIACHDGKARRAKPRISMLVDGMAGRSDLWSLAGNSICAPLATEVIAAFLDAEREQEVAAATVLKLPPLPY